VANQECEQYRPPLTVWSYVWRTFGCILISGLAWGEVVLREWDDHHPMFWIDVCLGAVAFVLVQFRRRAPLTVTLVCNALSAFSGVATGPAVLAAASLATRRVYWEIALAGVTSFTAGQVFSEMPATSNEEPFWVNLTVNLVATVAILGWGMYIGSRRELLWTLRDQVSRNEEEKELRADQARASERARIAREMHDVLAHRISQVTLHANAVMFREDLTAAQMRDSVAIIQQKANEALTDLRGVLGVLRDPATGEVLDKPQPTYADIPALVAETQQAGAHLEYDDLVTAGPVPELTGRTVYRIVQEGLTNARKHAPGSLVTVRLSGSVADGIDVLVRNPLGWGSGVAIPPSGLGLVGLRERAQLSGGRLEHGPDGSTWVLHGWIPWET
jgi:signal transduction histidine kinase